MEQSSSKAPLLFIITGSRGAGKTSLCDQLVRAAREAGWKTAGLLSRPVFSNQEDASIRSAIDTEDLRSGEVRRLAIRSDHPTPGTKNWKFDDAVVDWGNHVLASSTPVDLLVIDELGPLELDRRSGWQEGIKAIDSQQYAIALVVIHAELLGTALKRWPDANVVEVDTPEDSAHKASVLAEQLF
jgi:nucleoside-triphosphatase THEP1